MDVRAGLGHTLVLVVSLGPGGDNHREETRSRSRAPSAMNQSSWLDAVRVDGSPEALWEDGERRFYKIWRKTTDGTRRPYTAVVPAAEHPTRDSLDRLAHEYELKDQVDAAWAVRPVELVRERGETVLVLEYHDGEPLDRLIGRPMEVGRFLRVATALSTALARLHERGLVHKDIKPANILVDPTDDRVWLLGFGVASRIPRERQSPDPPELIAKATRPAATTSASPSKPSARRDLLCFFICPSPLELSRRRDVAADTLYESTVCEGPIVSSS